MKDKTEGVSLTEEEKKKIRKRKRRKLADGKLIDESLSEGVEEEEEDEPSPYRLKTFNI